jgi:hypothetical protein
MFRTYKVLVLVPILLLFFIVFSAYAAPPEEMVAPVMGLDSDDDGVPDGEDVCHGTPQDAPINGEGCSVHDICPCSHPWKNHGEYVSCVAKTSQDFVKAGLITKDERKDYVAEAAKQECGIVGGTIWTDYGDPRHTPRQIANDTFEITFAVTGDPQFYSMFNILDCGDHPSDRLLASQKTVQKMNEICKSADPECMGAFVAGDLTQTSGVQPIIAFRQLFEYRYPGDSGGAITCHTDDPDRYNRYSWGYQLGYPMFTLIGNHDDPTRDDNSDYVREYIDDLVIGGGLYHFPIEKRVSGTAPSHYFKGNYAWEWGSFHFISLGPWAFSHVHEDGVQPAVDHEKVEWLKEYLAAVGHEQAIVLFQHFGWDGFSFESNKDTGIYNWWSPDNADLLLNVLCNRDRSDQPCGTEEKPRYNVIGIFSGHTHKAEHHSVCAEKNTDGSCKVHFDNYIVNDAGPGSDVWVDGECPKNTDTEDYDCSTGFTMVHLNVWPEGYDRHTTNQMTVTNYDLKDWEFHYDYDDYDEYGHGNNSTGYEPATHSPHTKTGITSGLTTWDQGEPNGGRNESCATVKPNGRFNDRNCSTNLRFVCRGPDPNDPDNPLKSKLHLLSTRGAWEHGEFLCENAGDSQIPKQKWTYSLPKSFEEQAYLLDLIKDSGDPVWVNYSDQIDEGHWMVYPQDYFYFEAPQPNDGSQLFSDKGHGEDCAVINKEGQLEDRRCENERHSYVCKDQDGWYIHSEKGMWKQAFDADKCGEHGFVFPADEHEYYKMADDLKDDLEKYGSAWISLNDIIEEDNWVSVYWKNQCWGGNSEHQADLPSDTFSQISNGHEFSCGIGLEGTVQCWGNKDDNKLDVPDHKFLQISAGRDHACGVTHNKDVACWGLKEYGKATAPSGKFHQVSAGAYHTCGILNDGTLTCWGDDTNGNLDVPAGTFLQIDAGTLHTCGVREEPQFEGYWKLDEDSGPIAADSSANGYDGTLGNSPTFITDTVPTNFDNTHSLLFDRADHDYVTIPDTTHIDNLSQLSLSTWVKLNSRPSEDSSTTYMRFITLGNEKAVLRYVDHEGTGKLQFYMKIDEIFHSIVVDLPWATGVWYHAAGTYDGSRMRLYLNGVEKGNKEVSGTVATGNGVLLSHSGGASLDGLLDEVQIYDYALSSGDVEAMAAGEQHGDTGALACWGYNIDGQSDAPSGTFNQVSAGDTHTCGVRSDGTLACWGSNTHLQLDAPSGIFSQIDAGSDHTCGVSIVSPTQFEGYWNLDEGYGTIAADYSANGYDGALGNSPTWSSDTPYTNFDNSSSLRFDRADGDYVTIPGTTNIDNLSHFTLATWVKLTTMPDSIMPFVTLGNKKAVLRYDGRKYQDLGGVLSFYMAAENGTLHDTRKELSLHTGSWLHVAGTYDGITMRLYLDGVQRGTPIGVYSSLGGEGNGVTLSSAGEALDGLLDDVRIYNRALSRSEIEALAAGDHASSDTLACWGESSGDQLKAPSGIWDQVSAGGSTSCSTESFIHLWEDDFAAGRKYNSASDCAELYTYVDEDGKKTGKFYDRSCDTVLDHYACKRYDSDDWKITQYGGNEWKWGFYTCPKYVGFDRFDRFDAPMTEADNERLIDAVWKQVGEKARVWVNYSDTNIEGLWRHEYWENSFPSSQPSLEGHCKINYVQGGINYGIANADCDDDYDIVCHTLDDTPVKRGNGTWLEGQELCSSNSLYRGMWAPQHQLDEYRPGINDGSFWIRFTDLDSEGRWEDWYYGD